MPEFVLETNERLSNNDREVLNVLEVLQTGTQQLRNNNNRLREVRAREDALIIIEQQRERREREQQEIERQERERVERERERMALKNSYNLRDILNGHIEFLRGGDVRRINNEGIPRQRNILPSTILLTIRGFLTESLTNRNDLSLYQRIKFALMFNERLTDEQKERRIIQIINRIRQIRIILEELSTRIYPGRETYISYTNRQLRNWLINGYAPAPLLRTFTPNRNERRQRSMTPLSNEEN